MTTVGRTSSFWPRLGGRHDKVAAVRGGRYRPQNHPLTILQPLFGTQAGGDAGHHRPVSRCHTSVSSGNPKPCGMTPATVCGTPPSTMDDPTIARRATEEPPAEPDVLEQRFQRHVLP